MAAATTTPLLSIDFSGALSRTWLRRLSARFRDGFVFRWISRPFSREQALDSSWLSRRPGRADCS